MNCVQPSSKMYQASGTCFVIYNFSMAALMNLTEKLKVMLGRI